jgi:PhoH-like ATPase
MTQRKPASAVTRLPATVKFFVLDTNVLMHDPTSLFRFEEHDIYIPMATLEELDANKKGMSEVARNARQASRFLDEIVSGSELDIESGIELKTRNSEATGRLFLQTQAISGELPARLAGGKADNQIIGVVKSLQEAHPSRQVILVSKDINMRIKARALGFPAEDYFNDKVLNCRRISGTSTAKEWSRGSSRAIPITGCRDRSPPA